MVATRTRVVGPVVLPDGSNAPDGAVIVFSLPDWDKDGTTLIMDGPAEAEIRDGQIDIDLWRTTAGGRALSYDVSYRYYNGPAGRWISRPIGKAPLIGPGPVTLTAILALPAPVPNVPDALAQTLAAAEAVRNMATDADAVAADRLATQAAREETESYAAAAAFAGNWYDSIALGRAAVANGQTFGVKAGLSDGLPRPTVYQRTSASTQDLVIDPPRGAEVDVLGAKVDGPFDVTASSEVHVLRVDREGHAIEIMRPDGIDMHMSAQFWERGSDDLGIPDLQATVSEPFVAVSGLTVTATRFDAHGHAIEIMRDDGLDMHMSAQFWERGADILGLTSGGGGAGLSDTMIDIISINGQSLTVTGDWTATVTKEATVARVGPHALMLTGLKRSDGVALSETLGPRSVGYDMATPATGMAPALPPSSLIGLPFAAASALNAHRADAGVLQVPVLHSGHGISGVPIEMFDDNPATGGASDTTIWGNLTYWTAEAKRVVEATGKRARQPWYVWTHGTSAKGSARGDYLAKWYDLQADSIAYYASIGLPAPRWILTQSGGDSNTIGDVWAVVEDQLDICEQGGAVLATPLYWYEIADDNVHPDGEGIALFADTYGWAMSEVEAGRNWTITRPKAKWNAATSVLALHFDSLREDEWLVAESAAKYAASGGVGLGATSLGFEGVGATITSVTLRGHTVLLTCSAKPTAVKYARQVQDMREVTTGFANRYNAHRGLLRTSTTKPSKLVAGKTLVRAIPSFTLAIE